MPREPHRRTESNASPDPLTVRLTDEQLGRLADMIVEGRCQLPQDMGAADLARLDEQVKRGLRNRLVRFVARAVAHHLRRADGPNTETSEHV